jgi:hypothetical protein
VRASVSRGANGRLAATPGIPARRVVARVAERGPAGHRQRDGGQRKHGG